MLPPLDLHLSPNYYNKSYKSIIQTANYSKLPQIPKFERLLREQSAALQEMFSLLVILINI